MVASPDTRTYRLSNGYNRKCAIGKEEGRGNDLVKFDPSLIGSFSYKHIKIHAISL